MIARLHSIFKNSKSTTSAAPPFMNTLDYVKNISREILDCHDKKIPAPLRDHYKMLIMKNDKLADDMKGIITLYHQSYDRLMFYKNIIQFVVSLISSHSVRFIPLDRGINSVDITVDDVFNCMTYRMQNEDVYNGVEGEHPLIRLARNMMFEVLREYSGNSNPNLFKEKSIYDSTDVSLLNHYSSTKMDNIVVDRESPKRFSPEPFADSPRPSTISKRIISEDPYASNVKIPKIYNADISEFQVKNSIYNPIILNNDYQQIINDNDKMPQIINDNDKMLSSTNDLPLNITYSDVEDDIEENYENDNHASADVFTDDEISEMAEKIEENLNTSNYSNSLAESLEYFIENNK